MTRACAEPVDQVMSRGWSSRGLALAALLLASVCACRSAAAPGEAGVAVDGASGAALPDLSDWFVASGDAGRYQLAWRPVGGVVPRNQDFSLEVLLLREGRPHGGPRLVLRASMPAHGHGLVRAPVVTELGHGRYRVDAMLLHMRGLWVLVFDVTDSTASDSVRFELNV
ncbi:MAG: hypothetical protein DRQ55_01420 [Planctomycetota bacterium]|nr:MAG: hypothetical protein DRQ55_01420 [Planctomycetota bacterium]